jgi:hypothetical protein
MKFDALFNIFSYLCGKLHIVMKNIIVLFNIFIFYINKRFRLLIGKRFILENDTKIIHKLSKMKMCCKINKIQNKVYLSEERYGVYMRYNFFYKHCEHCNKLKIDG